jgi:hypothetical protein
MEDHGAMRGLIHDPKESQKHQGGKEVIAKLDFFVVLHFFAPQAKVRETLSEKHTKKAGMGAWLQW